MKRQNQQMSASTKEKAGAINDSAPADVPKVAKRTAKDSVFRDLFSDKRYLLQLYQALHPEDTSLTEDEIDIVTIKNILLDQMYNDLGFIAGNRLLILMEAQTTWSMNILVRILMYLAQSLQEYITSTGQNVYGSVKVDIPEPELYVIYTGKRVHKPQWISLSEEFFHGAFRSVEVKMCVLYDGQDGDIINQYVTFTKVFSQQAKSQGYTRKAVMDTIRICQNQNVLKEYLEDRKKEVVDIMIALFDEEFILNAYVAEKQRDAVKESNRQTVLRLAKMGMSADKIAEAFETDISVVKEWLEQADNKLVSV